ncbi:triose-phosphate isomerase [Chachezhania sediminis]|uniref:triose-phosphate isomerase n=1 Tax=Chachezhania sediminis TaxID=2599291 RepID=UPI00131EC5DF|nr:triose-phosphate isomerase [Chachezhania sediminis]
MRQKLAAGNWKMNGTLADLDEVETLLTDHPDPASEMLLCLPATLIHSAAQRFGNRPIAFGGQDCRAEDSGAFTGDISAPMLADAGASHVILGHSERRTGYDEHNTLVRAKARAAMNAGLVAIICVGESLEDREAENTLDLIAGQMSGSIPDTATGENLVLAYEPIWAIGTGLTPTMDQIAEVHDYMRERLERRFGAGVGRSVRLLYGGSVKPSNAAEIFDVPNVDGALVGGASLKAADFGGILAALDASPAEGG